MDAFTRTLQATGKRGIMTKEEQIDWLCRLRSFLNNGVIVTPWNKEFIKSLDSILEQKPNRKAGTPREDYTPLYNCENWIP